jgi:hypothetical protein
VLSCMDGMVGYAQAACPSHTHPAELGAKNAVGKPDYGCCWDLLQWSSSDGTCTGDLIVNHWGVNTTCYNSGGMNLRCLGFSIDFSPSNTPLQYNLHCGGCGASACSTFVMYEEQCNKGDTWTPMPPTSWFVSTRSNLSPFSSPSFLFCGPPSHWFQSTSP